jgi:alpha-tubulin suppressor-like RCC1 family protein
MWDARVLMQDGSVYCFGSNEHGQLGIGAVGSGPSDNLAHPKPARDVV